MPKAQNDGMPTAFSMVSIENAVQQCPGLNLAIVAPNVDVADISCAEQMYTNAYTLTCALFVQRNYAVMHDKQTLAIISALQNSQ